MSYVHVPVLLKEVIQYLDPRPGENFVDATLGGGGYSQAILNHILPDGKLLAIDLDEDAIENFKFEHINPKSETNSKFKNFNSKQIILHHGNFKDLDSIIKHHEFPVPDGIVADIGFSSYQLDQDERGLSFQKKEKLDMRFDKNSQGPDAAFIINSFDKNQLTQIFKNYGEEKFAGKVAQEIVQARVKARFVYTTELYDVIAEALPKNVRHKAADSARRIFQALRIATNHELENLQEFLPKAFNLLKPGGRLAVASFHSLEDRQVKQYFVGLTKGCVCPPEFPQCICGREPQGKILTKKLVTASPEEAAANPRSIPAKLRVIQKI